MNALAYVHREIERFCFEGSVCVDATAGRGYDTLFLANLVKESGKVFSFDIQKDAIESTRKLLEENCKTNVELILDSHAEMNKYVPENSADCIVFNLGYLPGGDHSIFTHSDSTIKAILSGLDILKKGGLMCVTVYYGGDSGYEEKDAVIPFLQNLDDKKYQVLMTTFFNWKKEPPIPFLIYKL